MKKLLLTFSVLFIGIDGFSQYNMVKTSVAFLGISPSTRSASMGDIGVATSNDASVAFWNPGKLVFTENYSSLSISHTPWMTGLIKGQSLSSAYAYINPTDVDEERTQIFAASYRYFSRGDLKYTDANGNETGTYRPSDFAVDFSYSRLLEQNTGLGLTFRVIGSNPGSSQIVTDSSAIKTGMAFALDFGYYGKFNIESNENNSLSVGASLLNFGSKIKFSGFGYGTFLPTTLKLGTGYNFGSDPLGNIYTIGVEFNKLLVPSTPTYDSNNEILQGKNPDVSILQGLAQSFYDAPGGFKEELREIQTSIGAEAALRDKFFFRAGVSLESKTKGYRNYATFGIGYKTVLSANKVGFDLGYIQPFNSDNPLKNTFRFSITVDIKK